MKNKKFYAAAAGAALAFTSAFAIAAFAQDNGHNSLGNIKSSQEMQTKGDMEMKHSPIQPLENMLKKLQQIDTKDFSFTTKQLENAPSTMTINPKGEIRITNGKVTAVSSDMIMVQIWMLNFTVHGMSAHVLAGDKHEFTFAQIAVGDMVDVLGQLDTATAGLINAQVIHDRTARNQQGPEERSRLQSVINELIQRLNAILTSRGQAPLPTPSFSASPTPSATPSPSLIPSPTPSATPSPTPVSPTSLKIGDNVKTHIAITVTTDPLTDPVISLGAQPIDAVGVITAGPRNVNGTSWWQVDFVNAPDGYANGGALTFISSSH